CTLALYLVKSGRYYEYWRESLWFIRIAPTLFRRNSRSHHVFTLAVDPLLPPTVSIVVASHLLGRSEASVRALLRSGCLTTDQGEQGISVASLAAYRGSEITPLDYLRA